MGICEEMMGFMQRHGEGLYMLDMSWNEVILGCLMEEVVTCCNSLQVCIVNERCCDCIRFCHETVMMFGLHLEYYAEVEDLAVGDKVLRIVRDVTRKEHFPKLICLRFIGLDCYCLCRSQWDVVSEAYQCCLAADVSLYDGNDVLLWGETVEAIRPIE